MFAFMVDFELLKHQNFQHIFLHLEGFFSSNPRNFWKKEQNLYFKELKEHFRKMSVLYQTVKTKERL